MSAPDKGGRNIDYGIDHGTANTIDYGSYIDAPSNSLLKLRKTDKAVKNCLTPAGDLGKVMKSAPAGGSAEADDDREWLGQFQPVAGATSG